MTFREMLTEDLDQVMEIETSFCHAVDQRRNVYFSDKRGHDVFCSRRKEQDSWIL